MVDHAREETWIVNIRNRLDEQFADLQPALAALGTSNDKPSIYSTGSSPKRFPIGILLESPFRDRMAVQEDMWEYVAFMTRWLGLDVTLFLRYMKEREDLVKSYYHDGDYIVGSESSSDESSSDLQLHESLLIASCFLAIAILLLQKVRNGAEILRGSRGNNSDPADQRSLQFSILYQRIMEEQIETKIDMLLIRNQIPWFVVEAAFTNSSLSELFGTHIDRLAMSCFDDLYPRVNKSKVKGGNLPSGGFKHLLHIFHWTRTPEEGKWLVHTKSKQEEPAKRFAEFYIPNATNLLESATSFKRLDSSSMDVAYSNKRISALMQVTPMHLFSYSNEIFRQLLNFEQRYPAYGLPVTAHFACMKSLLQTKADVKLFQKKGIVQNTMKGEEYVLTFLHRLGHFLVDEVRASIPDDLDSLSEKVIEHHERDVSIAYSEFKSQFCPNQWVIISVIAAITLFVLTFIQTVYSALGYYKGT